MPASKSDVLLRVWLGAVVSLSCADGDGAVDAGPDDHALTREELIDPATCQGCHPDHYREWASSMHAYASDDPVFVAMNQRGQRETDGELGAFCVRCHAPMAVREGVTTDGLDLGDAPEHLRGVTCYFCHNATGVGEHFNNGLTLADDTTMRAGIADPLHPGVHGVAYSEHHDRNAPESSVLCGACHDIVTPSGVHLERTLKEYSESLFAAPQGDSCQGCHMDARPGVAAAVPGAPMRTVHEHLWPAVDVAVSDSPDSDIQRCAVECALAASARVLAIEADGFGQYTVRLETNAGHHQPSGASQDRRLWLEFIAYDAAGEVLFESGRIADDAVEMLAPDEPGFDRNLFMYRDFIFDAAGNPTHDFWEAASSDAYPEGFRSVVLPAAASATTPHSIEARYQLAPGTPVARVTARLRMRPIGFDVLLDLAATSDLAPDVLESVPTFTIHGASVEWSPEEPGRLTSLWPEDLVCPDAYACLLRPDAPGCEE